MITWLKENRKIAFVLTFFMAIEIFYFSTLPGDPLSVGGGVWISRAYHFIAFFLFTFFLFILINTKEKIKVEQILLIFVIASFYAISDEMHQIFTPFRDCTFEDFMTNLVGINFAMLLHLFIKNKN
jgi:VanZ family protein